jgi:hypothetical protein
VALVTGAGDFKRRELESYMAPLLSNLGIRSRLWVVKDARHELPPAGVLAGVYAWLEEDQKRRRADVRSHPGLSASSEGVVSMRVQVAQALAQARADLRQPEHTHRAALLLEWVGTRWDRSEGGETAQKLLQEVRADPRRKKLLAEQAGAEERRTRSAEAQALERFGQTHSALRIWETLARTYPDSPEGTRARAEVKQILALLARTPYLGARFAGDTPAIEEVVPGGPAHRAGLRRGDRITRMNDGRINSLAELTGLFHKHKPGDKLTLIIQRGGKPLTIAVQVGAVPREEVNRD